MFRIKKKSDISLIFQIPVIVSTGLLENIYMQRGCGGFSMCTAGASERERSREETRVGAGKKQGRMEVEQR
jgi:hypothetical protein